MKSLPKAYASALLEIGQEENQTKELYEQCLFLQGIFANSPEYTELLSSPLLQSEEKKALLAEWATQLLAPLKHLLFLLCDKSQGGIFLEILSEYRNLYQMQFDILPVTAISAIPMPKYLLQELRKILEEKTKKQVLIENKVDPTCLGGLQLQMKDVQYDTSVQSRLEQLQRILLEI